MLDLVIISILVLLAYFFIDCGHYRASPAIHVFGTIVPLLVLKFTAPDVWPKRFMFTVIMWHVVDILNHAIDDGLKNNDSSQCRPIVSTWIGEPIDEKRPSSSLTGRDSPLISSPQLTDDSKPPPESTSPPPSTDAP